MDCKTAALTNCINEIGYNAFNNYSSITREDILSSFSQDSLELIWNTFALFIKQNYESGKGTSVKGFGTFTFTNMEYSLEGTTNQLQRDTKFRRPVFIASLDFFEGVRPGHYSKSGGLIYYTQKVNNSIAIVKLNFVELAIATGIPKEELVFAFTHLIKEFGESVKTNTFKSRDLPGVGVFLSKNNVFGMKFHLEFVNAIKVIPQKVLTVKRNIDLFMDVSKSHGSRMNDLINAEKAIKEIRPQTSVLTYITRSGEQWLKDKLDIDVSKIDEDERVLENVHPEQRFTKQTFFNCTSRTRSQCSSRVSSLKSLLLSNDILNGILAGKGQLIREMKTCDRRNNGIIARFDLIRAFLKANIHHSLQIPTITDIVNFYAQDIDYIDYYKLVTCLIKDIKLYLKGEGDFNPNQTNMSISINEADTNAGDCITNRDHLNFNQKFRLGPKTRLNKFNNTLSNSMSSITINPLTNLNNYDSLIVKVNEVQNEIKTIKLILTDILNSNKDNLNNSISFINLNSILQNYSITYTTAKILKLLKFIHIDSPNNFTLASFAEKISQCKVTTSEMTHDDIMKAYDQVKVDIVNKGGREMLFKGLKEITLEQFISNLKDKTVLSENILSELFNEMSNRNKTLTYSHYDTVFETPKEHLDKDFAGKAFIAINDHINKKAMTISEFFYHLLSFIPMRQSNTMSKETFINAFKTEHLPYDTDEAEYLFNTIDKTNEGIVDHKKFLLALSQDHNSLIKMQDIIKRMKLDIIDIAFRFDLKIDNSQPEQSYSFYQFKEKMKIFDYTFSNKFIEGLFYEMTKGEEILSTSVLLEKFDVFKKEVFHLVNNDTFKQNFIENLQSVVDYHTIKAAFEAIDKKFSGMISQGDFCGVISKFTNEFKDENIMKVGRLMKLIDCNTGNINYTDFINTIYFNAKLDSFIMGVDAIMKELQNGKSKDSDNTEECIRNFISELNALCSIDKEQNWLSFDTLLNYLRKSITSIDLKTIAKFDLDSDGKITYDDIKGILSRYTNTHFFKYENSDLKPNVNLYSSDYLSEETFKGIFKEIKSVQKKKNITDLGLFNLLDSNKDGLISNQEFNANIDKIIQLAPSIKDKLFNYLDYYHNGLVDLKTFQLRFKDYKSNDIIIQNNSSIEKNIMKSLEDWISSHSHLNDTELFAILDNDTDGLISLEDLTKFVIDVLYYSRQDFNDYKLERVMQSISLSKNKNIGLADIKELMNKIKAKDTQSYHIDLKETFAETTNQNNSVKKDNIEWIMQAVERFGLYISEKYETIDDFYYKYCEDESKLFKLQSFLNFHALNNDCFGSFNLSQDELLALFTSLDSHKKNYLTIDDIKNQLNLFDFYKNMHFTIKNFLQQNFKENTGAFLFFQNNSMNDFNEDIYDNNNNESTLRQRRISKKNFFEGLNHLFPNKYRTETLLKYIRNHFPSDDNDITYSKFSFIYFDKITPNNSLPLRRNIISKLISTRESLNRSINNNDNKSMISRSSSCSNMRLAPFKTIDHPMLKTPFDEDPLEKLKRIISSSNIDYVTYIKSIISATYNNSGIINSHELKNIIKHFNLGLTTLEIEDIVFRCRNRDNKINLYEFYRFVISQDKTIKKAICTMKQMLGEIKQLLYKYYSNPKLGFEFNDPDVTRKMDFDKFKKIVYEMYRREERPLPNFAILKSVYDCIDLRKDGIVDIQEWTKTFGGIEGKGDVVMKSKQVKALREWETSNDVMSIYKEIAHNKRIVKEKVKDFQGLSTIIQADNMIDILKNIFPKIKITNTQWKMIVGIADQSNNGLIDFELFIRLVDHSAKQEKSQPRFK